MDPENLETWNIHGHKVLVAFDIVEIEHKDNAMKLLWKNVRDHIKMNAYDPKLLSYEQFLEATVEDEESAFEPSPEPSLEETVLMRRIIDELIEQVRAYDPTCGKILDLIKADCSNQEIINRIGLKKSQAYKKIKEAQGESTSAFINRAMMNKLREMIAPYNVVI